MSDLKISGQSLDGAKPVVHLVLEGFIDGNTAPQLKQTLNNLIEKKVAYLIIDCAGLLYMSSAGFGVFMGIIDPFREMNGEFVIAAVPEKILQIFTTLGLENIIKFFSTVEEAHQYLLNN